MDKEKLNLGHKELLQHRLKDCGTFLSEYSFANLFLFRQAHDYHVLTEGEQAFIGGKTYDGSRFIMPTSDPRKSGLKELLAMARDHDFIFPVPEEWLPAFGAETQEVSFIEGDSDYVFTPQKLATYQGQKMHGQKNLLNQFLSLYKPLPQPLTGFLMKDATDILDVWQDDVNQPRGETDYDACLQAFELYDELVLCGGIYYVNKEPAGFIIGEELNQSSFALHFAKGKRKFKGLYQYMYNHFTNLLPQKYTYINFEQDMGKLALKIAKSSYHPDKMLKKFRVKLKEQAH